MTRTAAKLSPLPICMSCPFRKANHSKRVPKGMYSEVNIRRLWAGACQGRRLACTELASTKERGTVQECSGLLVLIAKHLRALDTHNRAAYQRMSTTPLHEKGIALWTSRLLDGTTPTQASRKVTVNPEEIVGDSIGVPWVCLITNGVIKHSE